MTYRQTDWLMSYSDWLIDIHSWIAALTSAMSKAVVWRRGGTGSFRVTATLWSAAERAVDVEVELWRWPSSGDSSMSGVEAQDCGRFFSSTLKCTTGLSKSVKCSECKGKQRIGHRHEHHCVGSQSRIHSHVHSHSLLIFDERWPTKLCRYLLRNTGAIQVFNISATAQHSIRCEYKVMLANVMQISVEKERQKERESGTSTQ